MSISIDVASLADALERAEHERRQIAPLIEAGAFDATAAYAVQRETARRRIARGDVQVGMKVGLTSEPMQRMLGVDEPDFGHLFETMRVADGGSFPVSDLLQPKVEGEIAVVLHTELRGPGVTDEDVRAACAYLTPAIEIIDSRIRDWKISLSDTIADNGSSARFVLGSARVSPNALDAGGVTMTLFKNGTPVGNGTGSAVLGAGPFRAVAWLANTLAAAGLVLQPGYVVLPGALSAAIVVAGGDTIVAEFAGLGAVSVSFV
ncbi:MAG: tesE [Candidatus Eremiobacteraeota bacterium]|nr:tesE [Candidatus Eremiobacteraeota bacterium]